MQSTTQIKQFNMAAVVDENTVSHVVEPRLGEDHCLINNKEGFSGCLATEF